MWNRWYEAAKSESEHVIVQGKTAKLQIPLISFDLTLTIIFISSCCRFFFIIDAPTPDQFKNIIYFVHFHCLSFQVVMSHSCYYILALHWFEISCDVTNHAHTAGLRCKLRFKHELREIVQLMNVQTNSARTSSCTVKLKHSRRKTYLDGRGL